MVTEKYLVESKIINDFSTVIRNQNIYHDPTLLLKRIFK